MNTTIIQVPIEKKTRDEAVKAARSSGFSSIQDVIRLFLHQFIEKQISVYLEPKPVKLSAKNDKRYAKMIEEVESGKVKPFVAHNIDALMNHLHGKDRLNTSKV